MVAAPAIFMFTCLTTCVAHARPGGGGDMVVLEDCDSGLIQLNPGDQSSSEAAVEKPYQRAMAPADLGTQEANGTVFHRFWWYSSGAWPSVGVLEKAYGAAGCTASSEACFQRLPTGLDEAVTKLLVRYGSNQHYVYQFDPGNRVAHQAWLAFSDGVEGQVKEAPVKGAHTWEPVFLNLSDSFACATSMTNSFVFGEGAFILGSHNCWCCAAFYATDGGMKSYCNYPVSYGVNTMLKKDGNHCEAATNVALELFYSGEPAGTTAIPPQTISAVGDPHMRNLQGEKFDIRKAGVYTLLGVPRGANSTAASLHIGARVESLGDACASLFITELNIAGKWLGEETNQITLSARQPSEPASFEAVGLKVGGATNLTIDEFLAKMPAHMVRARFEEMPAAAALPTEANKHLTILSAKFVLGPQVRVAVTWVVEKIKSKAQLAHSLWLSTSNLGGVKDAIGGMLGVDGHEEAAMAGSGCQSRATMLLQREDPAMDGAEMAIASLLDDASA